MSKVKKVFEPIVALLLAAIETNPKVRVSDVIAEVQELAKARVGEGGGGHATTFHKNEAGEVVGLRCYYFQKWFDPRTVETGKKANTPSGYNSMTKAGLNAWTKQQREYKAAKDGLLTQVAAGEVPQDQIGAKLEEFEKNRAAIIALPEGAVGYDTLEELLAAQTA